MANFVMGKDLNFALRFEANFIWTRTEQIEYIICALIETIQPRAQTFERGNLVLVGLSQAHATFSLH